MAGSTLAQLGGLVMGLAGLLGVVRAGQKSALRDDPGTERRLTERMDMERRMASYLASREAEPGPGNAKSEGASDERR